jgi:hypothetical protein
MPNFGWKPPLPGFGSDINKYGAYVFLKQRGRHIEEVHHGGYISSFKDEDK